MKKNILLLALLFFASILTINAQKTVDIDGRLQPLLNEFFAQCKKYDIEYNTKLFQLDKIDIVSTLPLEENATVLGKVQRNQAGEIKEIQINWAALLDPEILKVVAFHEFAHHFLDYKHTCQDCNEIMAVTNTSYFDIARDWDNQGVQLFTTSPVYITSQATNPVVYTEIK